MYDKTITVFNKYVNQKDEIFWYPTVIKGVQLIVDKSANIEKTGLMLEVLVEDTRAENHLAYVEEVMVTPQSYGGDTSGVNIPFKVSSDGKRTEGYVSATSLASGNPEFTAGTIPHSLSTGKEVL